MQVRKIIIDNFRGIKHANLSLFLNCVLIGDNNAGKTTVLEALDLVLGPERLNRFPVIDEHDFFEGKYYTPIPDEDNQETEITDVEASTKHPEIKIEVIIINLSEEQQIRFGNYAEWWDEANGYFYNNGKPNGVDSTSIKQALRVTFIGRYNQEDDDFEGQTYFSRSLEEDETPSVFGRKDKSFCGFLYLRSRRTGNRALSLERGSLLDIILRLKEIRPQMWEETINKLSSFDVAANEELGISGILQSINNALQKYVPKEWGTHPHLKVSNLTREHLRKIITAFIATGAGEHAAPFYRQGTGTINLLVLAMLSQIAEDKQNVIFAMEEPETAVPPYAQKRIVQEVKNLVSQAVFTSHSPYVLEEFSPAETLMLSRSNDGFMTQSAIKLPASVKLKRYRQEFRTRFCEGLLAPRIFVAEGATEASCMPVAARRLAELSHETYTSLEALGICTIDAGSETQIPDIAEIYCKLGKHVCAVCDEQEKENKDKIEAVIGSENLFMHSESSIEKLILKESCASALERFASALDWPPHILEKYPEPNKELQKSLSRYFKWAKGNWGIADFLAQCEEHEMPKFIRDTCAAIKHLYQADSEANDDAVSISDLDFSF